MSSYAQPQPNGSRGYPAQNQGYGEASTYAAPDYKSRDGLEVKGEFPSTAASNSNAGSHPPKFNSHPRYTDLWATVLFVLHLAAFTVLAGFGLRALKDAPSVEALTGLKIDLSRGAVVGGYVLSAAIAFCLSTAYFFLMERFASVLINGIFISSIAVYGLAAAALLFRELWLPGIALSGLALIALLCWLWWRSRIPFATVMLQTVTGITKKHKGIIAVSAGGVIVHIAYAALCVVTFFGIMALTQDSQGSCKVTADKKGRESSSCPTANKRAALIIFAVFSFYWVTQVLRAIVHVTMSGVFAAFYFLEGSAEGVPSSPTLGSLKRALTTSFGTICFGSLILAVIQTIRFIITRPLQQQKFVGACILCLVDWIDSLIQYFNHYAFSQVAIYGKDFCTAAKDTWALIKARGIDAIINDSLIGLVLHGGAIFVGILTGILSYLYCIATDVSPLPICIVGLILGYVMMLVLSEAIRSGVATTFVALAEDPAALARTKPELYERIRETYPAVAIGI